MFCWLSSIPTKVFTCKILVFLHSVKNLVMPVVFYNIPEKLKSHIQGSGVAFAAMKQIKSMSNKLHEVM